MGLNTLSVISYGFIIPQTKVLELRQSLIQMNPANEGSNEEEGFMYQYEDAEIMLELLEMHLKEGGISGEDFNIRVLQQEDDFEGLAVLYNAMYDGQERSYGVRVLQYGGESFAPLLPRPWNNNNLVGDADAAFKRLQADSLFKALGIEVDPQWLLGGSME